MASLVSPLRASSEREVSARLAQLQARIAGRMQLGYRSKSLRYGLCRDLGLPLDQPSAKIPIAVRALADADIPLLLPVDNDRSTSLQDRMEIAWRRAFIRKGARNGFVAIDRRNGTPCYVQWLFGAADNAFIRRLGGFPQLAEHEALLENAYTPRAYRGLGIMSEAMALIAERARDLGVRHVLTFVDQQNIASLKGCQRAGFHPHILHHRVQMGFGLIKHDTFETLAYGDPRRNLRLA